jgi:branched-chain amino acid aminotransferase
MANPNYAFLDGDIKPYADCKVGLLTHALHYGTAVFGGLRGYWSETEQQLFVFNPAAHYRRFIQSAKLINIQVPYSIAELTEFTCALLRREALRQNCYIRPLAFFSEEKLGVRLHNIGTSVTMLALPWGEYFANVNGMHLTFSSWRRIDDNMIPARGKIAGAYVNSAFIKTDAELSGFDDALVLTADGHLSEGSAMNVMLIRDGVVVTPAITHNILEGITRRLVIQILREDFGLEVQEREVDRTEVYLADELFSCGSGTGIGLITKVDHRPVGTGTPGPIASRLRDYYQGIVNGKVEKYRHLCHPVY